MSYENEIIRAFSDAANPKTDRRIAIVDQSKLEHLGLTQLRRTAEQLGLKTNTVDGYGEDGEPTKFMVAAITLPEAIDWALDLKSVVLDGGFRAGTPARRRLQRTMGLDLGYSAEDIESFLDSEIASTCQCTCCGGQP